jgi:hypothetical protein
MIDRTEELQEKLDGSEDADSIMMSILEVFTETEWVPEPGKYYTFLYIAKSPDITYDEHPLIACMEVLAWGFKGLNFHWGTMRNYTWQEVVGALHVVNNDEIEYLRSLSYAKYRTK